MFFSAKGKGADARFVYENEVQKWLDLIRGAYLETWVDDLKLGDKKPAMPYADVRLLNVLQHTLWFLPNVASCYAMKNLLMQKQNTFYHDYTINVWGKGGGGPSPGRGRGGVVGPPKSSGCKACGRLQQTTEKEIVKQECYGGV